MKTADASNADRRAGDLIIIHDISDSSIEETSLILYLESEPYPLCLMIQIESDQRLTDAPRLLIDRLFPKAVI